MELRRIEEVQVLKGKGPEQYPKGLSAECGSLADPPNQPIGAGTMEIASMASEDFGGSTVSSLNPPLTSIQHHVLHFTILIRELICQD